eukprot:7360790-Pyramimonas_sp.AAC.1
MDGRDASEAGLAADEDILNQAAPRGRRPSGRRTAKDPGIARTCAFFPGGDQRGTFCTIS